MSKPVRLQLVNNFPPALSGRFKGVKNMDTPYSLSPSAAARWIACPGSENIIRQLPRLPSTPAAEEGTLAHEFAAWVLAGTFSEALGAAPINGMPKEPEQALATEEMLSGAQTYADSAFAKVCEIFGNTAPQILVEGGCSYSERLIRIGGRLDFAAISADTVMVVDYKFGGALVPVRDNPQLLTYALCMTQRFDIKPKRIFVGIVQPRSEGTDFATHGAMWAEYDADGFGSIAEDIKAAAREACNADDRSPRATGDHCKYCPARSVCRAAIGEKLLLAAIAAGESQMSEDATNEQIGRWLATLKEIDYARDDLARVAKARMEKGETVPGWRLQRRKSLRWPEAVTNGTVDEAVGWLAEHLDARAEDFITRSVKSPAQMAKVLPKETIAKVAEETTTTALVAGGAK